VFRLEARARETLTISTVCMLWRHPLQQAHQHTLSGEVTRLPKKAGTFVINCLSRCSRTPLDIRSAQHDQHPRLAGSTAPGSLMQWLLYLG
jgi:hypothetical protein